MKVQRVSSPTTLDELAAANQPAKKATPPSSVQRQAQAILEARGEPSKSEIWPVYAVFLFAFAVLGYTLYHLGR